MSKVLGFLRKTFTGRTDTYLDSALSGNDVLDVTGTFFEDHSRDYTHTRLARYKRNWRFYRGEHFEVRTIDGQRKLAINYCRPIINKSVDWLFGSGFKITTPPGNENIVPLLDMVWRANDRDKMLWEHGQMGAVTGDAFLYITVEDRGVDGKPLPLDQQKIVIRNINSSYVHPIYDESDEREMYAVLIQFPTVFNSSDRPLRAMTLRSGRPLGLYSIIITRREVVEYWNRDEIPGSRRKNFLGRIPVVHTRNIPIASSFFGESDIDDIIPLNEHINEAANDIDSIIKYHSAPTTLIFGARAQQLEKSPNQVWSGLPEKARVENLGLEGELEAAVNHLKFLKLSLHEISNTPENSLGSIQEISNTSAAALEVTYLPLIEKTRRKYTTYGSSIVQANEIVLQILDQRFGVKIGEQIQDKTRMYETGIEFNSPLPRDEKLVVDMLVAKMEQGLESRAGALRTLGVKDVKRRMLEILADQRQTLAEDVERAVAALGERPVNLNVYALGSYGLNLPELEASFQAQDTAYDELLSEMEKTEEGVGGGESP